MTPVTHDFCANCVGFQTGAVRMRTSFYSYVDPYLFILMLMIMNEWYDSTYPSYFKWAI